MSLDFTYFLREQLPLEDLATTGWDVFVSAYNESERVRTVWEASVVRSKIWVVHHEYDYVDAELPDGEVVNTKGVDESQSMLSLIDRIEGVGGRRLPDLRICIDITGFMRAELVSLVRLLLLRKSVGVDFLYCEPGRYRKKAWTNFALGNVHSVRQVIGCEGVHNLSANDYLVIGTGYDDALMSVVAEHKPQAAKALMLGFPSLAPDMYQENIWRVSRASESIGAGFASSPETLFAPANDPFVTASVVARAIARNRAKDPQSNVYLAPLGTKVQALGFALFYGACCRGAEATSVILPFVERYERETSRRLGRLWRYSVDFSALA